MITMLDYKSEFSEIGESQSKKSLVPRDGGTPFQTSGPQTANERRPSSVHVHRMTTAQVEAEHRDRLFCNL